MFSSFHQHFTVDKIFTDINMILFLIFTQQAWHQFECKMMHAQIFSENLISCGFLNSSCLCYFVKSETTIGTNHFPNFLDAFFFFWCWRLSWTFTVLNWSLALFKMFVPQHGFVFHSWLHPQTLVLTFQKSPKTFSLIWNKISHKHVAYENHPLLITEKFAQQARHIHCKTEHND